jgi:T5SS/PEP-CTERM-associated repeat protein
MRNTSHLRGLVSSCLIVGMLTRSVEAADKVWVDNVNQNWPTAGNWSPSGMPGTADTAIFNLGNLTPPYNVLFVNQFQAINAVADKLRIDSNPITFTGAASTLTLDSTDSTATGRGLIIGRNVAAPGVSNAALENLLSQFNTVYATLGADAGSSGTLNVNGGTFSVTGTGAVWDLIIGSNGAGTIALNNGSDAAVADDTMLGLNAGSSGSISINGSGSLWTNTGDLRVGGSGGGTLAVEGGQLSNATGHVGSGAGSIGSATISGGGANWTNNIALIVGNSGEGTLNITNGSSVSSANSTYIGYLSDGVGFITASGSTLTSSLSTIVGSSGVGSLGISNGGLVTDTFGILGQSGGSEGAVTVSGTSSTWNNSSDIWVGDGGHGSLELSDGGHVTNVNAYIADNPGSDGDAFVNGNSLWECSGELYVGNQGEGTMEITTGGVVTNSVAYVGNQPGASGEVTINAGAWNIDDQLHIGKAGGGTMDVSGGGDVSCHTACIACEPGSSGAVTLDGSGTTWNSLGVSVGTFDTNASLSITGGAVLSDGLPTLVQGGGSIRGPAGDPSVVTIDGALSRWEAGLALGIYNSILNLTNGGRASGFDIISIGGASGSIVTVDGPGSVLTAPSNLGHDGLIEIGGAGSTLTITNGGLVQSKTTRIGLTSLATAEAIIEGAGSAWQTGQLHVGNSDFGAGTLSLLEGGHVLCTYGFIDSGEAIVDGEGSMLTVDLELAIPAVPMTAGSGVLTITNGGAVSVGTMMWLSPGFGYSAVLNISEGGTLSVGDVLAITTGGELHAEGAITGDTQNGGLIAPGTSRGILTIDGDYTQTANGELVIELASVSSYDELHVTGAATLGGTLTVNLIKGYTPLPGHSFTILTSPDVGLTFAVLNLPAGMQISYTADSVIVEVPGTTCPADIAPLGGDNTVNVDDLLAVIGFWGACFDPNNCPADIAPPGLPMGDDIVNVDDLLAVINAWGACP